jgi:hypothetical protein
MERPGSYEKLRARELAQAVALNYVIIVDAAHQLSDLGNAPGVMSDQVHKVFTTVAKEIDDLILQRKDEAMTSLLSRWKDPVLAVCKELQDTSS